MTKKINVWNWLVVVLFMSVSQVHAVEITDMAGRKVDIPARIGKIFCSSPASQVLIYSVSPDLLVGVPFRISAQSRAYFPERYLNLPVTGGWFGKSNSANLEAIIQLKPDVILAGRDATSVEMANHRQEKLGIPIVLIRTDILGYAATYRFLGRMLNQQDRTEPLARYSQETIEDIQTRSARISPASEKRVYYAEGPKGLLSEPKGSEHAMILDMIHARNIAQVPLQGRYGRAMVSMEEILKWQPDVILCGSDHGRDQDNCDQIAHHPVWGSLKAIQTGAFYPIPAFPFNWFDRPPSVNRLIGLKWTANMIYPEIYPYDMKKETRYFYQLFYHYALSDVQLNHLLSDDKGEDHE